MGLAEDCRTTACEARLCRYEERGKPSTSVLHWGCVKGGISKQRLRGVELFKQTGAKVVLGLKIFPRSTEGNWLEQSFDHGTNVWAVDREEIVESEHRFLERRPRIGLCTGSIRDPSFHISLINQLS
jgi:hypothetical protein